MMKRMVTGICSSADFSVVRPSGRRYRYAPEGVTVSLPIALLLAHDQNKRIGTVTSVRPNSEGVSFDATIESDAAWRQLLAGGLRGCSQSATKVDTDEVSHRVYRVNQWRLHEISLCEEGEQRNGSAVVMSVYHTTEDEELQPMTEERVPNDSGWDVEGLPQPSYPWGARLSGDAEQLEKGHAAFMNYAVDQICQKAEDAGDSPMRPVSAVELCSSHGAVTGKVDWLSYRCKELEDRLAALESGMVAGSRFMGIYQKQIAYSAGNLVTCHGSLWHCNSYALEGCEPGSAPAIWTLCSKGGEPPKPQRETAGHRVVSERVRKGKTETTTVTRHDDLGRILEIRKHTVE